MAREPQLIVTRWPCADDPLIIVSIGPDQVAALKPGFATWHHSSLVIPYHPRARVEYRPGYAAFYVATHLIAHGSAHGDLVDDPCMVGLVESSLMWPEPDDPAERFLDLLEMGRARIAEVAIHDWEPCGDVA